ncbi:hypothetical protein AK95_03600 [Paenibacillus sp. LC231]|nr:hypothetical protein AK95_03600 [Paenibacillus sp. LC231]
MVNSSHDESGTYERAQTAALSFDRDKKRHFFDMKHIFQPLQMGGRYAFLLMYLFEGAAFGTRRRNRSKVGVAWDK